MEAENNQSNGVGIFMSNRNWIRGGKETGNAMSDHLKKRKPERDLSKSNGLYKGERGCINIEYTMRFFTGSVTVSGGEHVMNLALAAIGRNQIGRRVKNSGTTQTSRNNLRAG